MKLSTLTEQTLAKGRGFGRGRSARAAGFLASPGAVARADKPVGRSVIFSFRADSDAEVFLAGTFNGWDPSAHPLKPTAPDNELHQATLALAPGRHEYKFVVNGTWQADPQCPTWVVNPFGSLNSVIEVGSNEA